jgi:hypothetical protein
METLQAVIWPNGDWCWMEDFDPEFGYGSDKSDDYRIEAVPAVLTIDNELVEIYIANLIHTEEKAFAAVVANLGRKYKCYATSSDSCTKHGS